MDISKKSAISFKWYYRKSNWNDGKYEKYGGKWFVNKIYKKYYVDITIQQQYVLIILIHWIFKQS